MLGKVEICGVNTSRLQTLSNEEMMRLIELAQKGDQAAKQRLVEGNLKLVPYHELSAGETRDGEETFHDKEYSYLKSVDSSQDKESEDFLTEISLSVGQIPDELKIKEYDQAGYVLSLETEGEILEGEAFAWGIGLPSSNFLIQREDDQLRIVSKGKGHGLGFSQYGGNELAKEGKTWKEILNTYFPEMEISNYL